MTTALIALLLLSLTLSLSLFRSRSRLLQKINDTLLDIRSGQRNRVFRLHTSDRAVLELAENLNGLVQDFNEAQYRANESERARKQMISNLSHDLRTPVTAMLGYIDELRHDSTLTEDERTEYLNIISDKGEHLSRLIQDLFALAKLEETKGPERYDRIHLNELVHQEVLQLYIAFTEAGIKPELRIPKQPIYVSGCADSLRRVLSNLLTNAIRYGKEGREIGVSVWTEENKAWVEVWDRGAGIRADDLPYVFDRLYTGADSRNPSLQGTGIGLTVAKMLIEQHGGDITASSIPYQKTAFTFYLPLLM